MQPTATAEAALNRLPTGKFAPGNKANPGGRPKVVKDVQELARKHTKEAIETLVELMQRADSDHTRVAAAKEILDRAYGKSMQAVQHAGANGQPLKLYIGISPDEWEASNS